MLFSSSALLGLGVLSMAFGIDSEGSSLIVEMDGDFLNPNSDRPHVLVVGDADSSQLVGPVAFAHIREISVKPEDFPPGGDFYRNEAQYFWRWVEMHGPDLILEVTEGDERRLPEEIHGIPVQTMETREIRLPDSIRVSAQRDELRKRLNRKPQEVIAAMSQHYGQELQSGSYIEALALMMRLRNGEKDAVEAILKPWLDGTREPNSLKTGGTISGRLIFGDWAKRFESEPARWLLLEAADLAFDEDGNLREAMPTHNEMSDAVFMAGPVLARAGLLTGEDKYWEMCQRHLDFMKALCLREDGLYRHSPLDKSPWGRGNGFPALGHAMILSDLAEDHPLHAEIREAWKAHLEALAPHQDAAGMWHQVVDHPGSYAEFSSTCMIGFSVMRGLRMGWLEKDTWHPVADRAWEAILRRIALDGDELADVCTGTGKQKNQQAYLDRKAIYGRDDRGGAMALMLATERLGLERGE